MLSIINSNKVVKLLVQILSILILAYVFTISVKIIYNFGTYLGTFIRGIYHIVIC